MIVGMSTPSSFRIVPAVWRLPSYRRRSSILASLSSSSGSPLEQVFAIYSNVLQIDADGMVLNDGDAQHRVAQWVRARCDPSFRVEPPFEDWELELHL
jgi:hypothetical protein